MELTAHGVHISKNHQQNFTCYKNPPKHQISMSLYLPCQSSGTVEKLRWRGQSFLSLYQGKEKLAFTCCFSPGSAVPADLWAGHRTWCRKQHCSSAPLNHPFSTWSLTSLSPWSHSKVDSWHADYDLICAPPPTEHSVLTQGWLCFFKSLSHFILQIKKLGHPMYQIHPLQLLCM